MSFKKTASNTPLIMPIFCIFGRSAIGVLSPFASARKISSDDSKQVGIPTAITLSISAATFDVVSDKPGPSKLINMSENSIKRRTSRQDRIEKRIKIDQKKIWLLLRLSIRSVLYFGTNVELNASLVKKFMSVNVPVWATLKALIDRLVPQKNAVIISRTSPRHLDKKFPLNILRIDFSKFVFQ